MNYEEIIDYIDRIPKFTSKHARGDTRAFLDALGAPDDVLAAGGTKIIHVAGTNGKGSVSNYLAQIARAAGQSAGLFISPHLTDIRERMSVNGEYISREEFASCFEKVRGFIAGEDSPETREKENPGMIGAAEENAAARGLCFDHPSYFEYLFLMAMVWFGEKRPDVLILETGLGGRLDATNCVRGKTVTVVTRIGLDHMQYLGDSIEKIAAEKAGIFRGDVPAVVQSEPPEALAVFREKAAECGALLYTIPADAVKAVTCGNGSIDFSIRYRYDKNAFMGTMDLSAVLHTAALYQKENAALAAAAAGILGFDKEAIADGLSAAFWPGRMEEVRPGVYIDGGHNPDGIRAFLESVRLIRPGEGGTRTLLFSAVADKQYDVMMREILEAGLFTRVIAAPMNNERGLTGGQLMDALTRCREKLQEQDPDLAGTLPALECRGNAAQAFRDLVRGKKENELLFAAGSLYLVGILQAEK